MGFDQVFQKLKGGLSKTRESFFGKIQRAVYAKSTIDAEVLDHLEEALITSDVGVAATGGIIERIRTRVKEEKYETSSELLGLLKDEISKLVGANGEENSGGQEGKKGSPHVVLVVGVNGAGKTTTVGKLAALYRASGGSVLVGAADTFRAAANEQLEIWAQRAGVEVIQQKGGADPAAVAYDTLNAAMARDADVVIIDTAGRLHTRVNLMEELKKIRRVLEKRLPGCPHEVLLVLDATTGQNGLQQARRFTEAVGVTGLVLTKLDGTAKGGIVFAIRDELHLPVRFVGVGEGLDDLQPFDARAFVEALFQGSDELVGLGKGGEEQP